MKTLKESILSSTKTGTSAFLIPETTDELEQMIKKEIREKGYKCDLNHIKTHKITDMSRLFSNSKFVGDISKWDVSNVKTMYRMFYNSKFNGDISNWNVRKVEDMESMFGCSKFNGDISNWNISNIIDMENIFTNCPIKEEYKPSM
jgi:surface protein